MKILQVSGPVSATFFELPAASGKNSHQVMIFGDVHFSNANMCTPCKLRDGCASIVELIDQYVVQAKAEGTSLDVFLELPFVPAKASQRARAVDTVVKLLGKAPPPGGLHGKLVRLTEVGDNTRYVGLLGNLLARFKNDLYHDGDMARTDSTRAKSTHIGGVRFHYADIRYDANIRRLLPSQKPMAMQDQVNTSDAFRALLQAFLFGQDFVADVNACCRDAKVFPGSLSTLKPNGPRVHRVAKQFHRLPEGTVKNAVRAYLATRIEEIVSIMRHDVGYDGGKHTLRRATPSAAGYEPWLSKVRAVHAEYHAFAYHDAMHLGVYVLLMDAYLLCRMLRFAAPRGVTIVYAGDAHADFLSCFFRDFLELQPKHDFAASSKRSHGGRERRCVDVTSFEYSRAGPDNKSSYTKERNATTQRHQYTERPTKLNIPP